MNWIDITRTLAATTAPWPGDTPYSLAWQLRIADGQPCNLSTLTLSVHLGTHADAPYHSDDTGQAIGAADLSIFLGPARVLRLADRPAVTAADLAAFDLAGVERLLVRTDSNPDLDRFHPGFTSIGPDAAAYLASLGIRLLGTDAPSVDPFRSEEMASHRILARHGIYILENLDLSRVSPGEYELVALPLRLHGAEASPVRALLRQKTER